MLSEEKIDKFISYALDKVYFYIESKFWSKPNMKELNNWLRNFRTLEERYCALKLLDRFVYYSEEDIIHLMKYGINEKIIRNHIYNIEQNSGFLLSNCEIKRAKKKFLEGLYFIKLDTGNPSESSGAMLRYLTVSLGFRESNILDINNLNSIDLEKCDNLIIIDDFIGSGNQIIDFWNYKKVKVNGEEMLFYKLGEKFKHMSIEYFCLVCTEEGYYNFALDNDPGRKTNLKITYSEMLSNRFRVFGNDSMYFDDKEMDYCKEILQNICVKNNIDFLGYESLDYAIALHHSIPDCSLPLFYKNNDSWNYLFRNKKTESDANI